MSGKIKIDIRDCNFEDVKNALSLIYDKIDEREIVRKLKREVYISFLFRRFIRIERRKQGGKYRFVPVLSRVQLLSATIFKKGGTKIDIHPHSPLFAYFKKWEADIYRNKFPSSLKSSLAKYYLWWAEGEPYKLEFSHRVITPSKVH